MNAAVLKKDLGLNCEHIVGFIGRLLPEKGLTVLLDALRLLPPSVHALIIGAFNLTFGPTGKTLYDALSFKVEGS